MALTPVANMTFLQLVQQLYREVGAAGGTPTTAIPTTANTTGEILRLVNYVHDAELDIQNMWVDWKWLRQTLTFYTAAQNQTGIFTTSGGSISAYPTDLAEWDWKSFFIYPVNATSPQPLATAEWQEVRNQVFNTTSYTQPWRVIVMPNNTFRFDNIPDQSYQCFCEYRTVPYDLKNDADVSNIPTRFANRVILEMARLKYGMFENAPEQVAQAKLQLYGTVTDDGIPTNMGLLAALENDQLPNRKNSRRQQGNNIVVSTDYGVGYDSQNWDGSY
jgi:hypothetical protein